MNIKKKILYISGTRADYGIMKSTLYAISARKDLSIEIAATGMHLMPEFGMSIDEIVRDGFTVHKIDTVYETDDKKAMACFIGSFTTLLSEKVAEIKPDLILVLGDRGEMLAAAIVGAYMSIPVAHVAGGEVTSTVDEITRHAITKLSHIHLTSTKKSAERVAKMGEDKWRIHVVGAPGMDAVKNQKLVSREDICKKLGLDPKNLINLVVQHAVSIEADKAAEQMRETMEAMKDLGEQTVVIYPNSDAGGRKMIEVIEEYRKLPFIHIFKNLVHEDYLSLLSHSKALIGNSSSGIVEAPSFKVATIEIGTRQDGRERARSVIDVGYSKTEILKAIKKAGSKELSEKLKKIKNPYGDGKTGNRIADILSKVRIEDKLIQKRLAY
jgi:GDP/UDP-N,N'-diacetylbacillosamine 2-epimerase (hydrolysing)